MPRSTATRASTRTPASSQWCSTISQRPSTRPSVVVNGCPGSVGVGVGLGEADPAAPGVPEGRVAVRMMMTAISSEPRPISHGARDRGGANSEMLVCAGACGPSGRVGS